MSTLTSSAVGGSKAKPKAPPRRRAAAPGSAPSQPVPAQSQDETTAQIVAETTTQTPVEPNQDAQPPLPPPSPPAVVERPVHGIEERELAITGEPTQDTAPNVQTQSSSGAVDVVSTQAAKSTRKRTRETDTSAAPVPNKRAKQSSIRSAGRLQTAVEAPTDAAGALTATVEASSEDTSHEHQTTHNDPTQPADATNGIIRSGRARRPTQRRLDAERGPNVTPVPRRGKRKAASVSDEQAITNLGEAMNDQTEANAVADTLNAAAASQPSRRRKKASKSKAAAAVVENTEHVEHADEMTAESQAVEEAEETHKSESDDPEDHKIDPKTLSMYDLSHDNRYGRVSEREKKMAQIDWGAVRLKRMEEAEAIARGDGLKDKESTDAVQSTEDAGGQVNNATDPAETAEDVALIQPVTRASGGGVRFRLVNGTIVEDADSLTIDRAARVAEAAAQETDVAVEEENDLTRRLNRTTWINARKRDETERVPHWKSKSSAWNEEDTDRFYEALRMFGTDFFLISQLFEGRTRRMIKLKFVREERLEPDRINAALLGQRTGTIDLGVYAEAIGKDENFFNKYDSLEHANETIRESFKDKEEAMRAAVKEDEENNRQREHQRQQREKQRLEAEKKKEERARKKAARRRGDVWGAGTLGGADDDGMDDNE
ncbi:hypothetical protein AMS68_004294 [Peltaster fructicola]|uniref:SANT domain-containing protein n=1 Tax=Peltaster fructicola TaxID=286661 RepID=A0A6H0XVJ3_9PEZI|nr:hypothetical protein AMS68_004294 [Peltaster fructicola]